MVSGYISGNFGQFYYVIVIMTPLLEVVIEFSNDSSYERSSPNSTALMFLKNVYQKDAIQFHQTPKLYSLTIWKVKALIWSRTPQAEDDDKKYAFYML